MLLLRHCFTRRRWASVVLAALAASGCAQQPSAGQDVHPALASCRSLMESGQYGQAALACAAAVSADSGGLQPRELLAVALVRQGRAEEAVPHYAWLCDRAGDATPCIALA